MSRNKKKHQPHYQSTTIKHAPSIAKINKALQENRTSNALEMALLLYQGAPNAQHKDVLVRASFAHAQVLAKRREQAHAVELLNNLLAIDNTSSMHAKVASQFARCGLFSDSRKIIDTLDDPEKTAAWNVLADEAIRAGRQAGAFLTPTLQKEFDLLHQAFALSEEEGRDEEVRQLLQGIGLRSPFLEWKLLLRGLLAFYEKDHARALDNWQRLSPARLPFKLSAPFRFQIDSEFAAQQAPAKQQELQNQGDQLQESVLLRQLRIIQRSIASEEGIEDALEQARHTRVLLEEQAPNLVPRLASCFYWAIVQHGNTDDIRQYRRIFRGPPDDPELHRLNALRAEDEGAFAAANACWAKFEASLARNTHWPEVHKRHGQALVWQRMGQNAVRTEEIRGDDEMLPPFLLDHPARPKLLKPGAAECFERSLQLAPDHIQAYKELLTYYDKHGQETKAEEVCRRLLEQFPNDTEAREKLGDLLLKATRYGEALEQFNAALKSNPLEVRLRDKVSIAHLHYARQLAENDRFDEARQHYQSSLDLIRKEKYPTLCKWAACEFKAGNIERGQQLLEEAQSEQQSRLAVVFSLLIELIRFNLNKLKLKFNKEFNALLAEQPTGAAAAALATTTAQHRQAGVTYYGQQTHEKKVVSYLQKALSANFTAEQLITVCESLQALKKFDLMLKYVHEAMKRFPASPQFYIMDAELYLQRRSNTYPWAIGDNLKKARDLISAMPRGAARDKLMEQITEIEREIAMRNPFSTMLEDLLHGMPDRIFDFDPDDGFDDEDYDEDRFYFE